MCGATSAASGWDTTASTHPSCRVEEVEEEEDAEVANDDDAGMGEETGKNVGGWTEAASAL